METNLYKDIGKRIKTIRQKRGITQVQLSEKVGLTRTSITNIENGRQKIMIHDLYRIADELSTTINEVLPPVEDVIIKSKNLMIDSEELAPNEFAFVKKLIRTTLNNGDKK